MTMTKRVRTAVAVAACTAVGAAGEIAGSTAAPGGGGGPGPRGAKAVHVEAVVLNKARDAFITETLDHGKVKTISGSDITITESARGVTYKDVTITIPAGATIKRNGKTAALSALKVGDRVEVARSSDGTRVHAGARGRRQLPSPAWRQAPLGARAAPSEGGARRGLDGRRDRICARDEPAQLGEQTSVAAGHLALPENPQPQRGVAVQSGRLELADRVDDVLLAQPRILGHELVMKL